MIQFWRSTFRGGPLAVYTDPGVQNVKAGVQYTFDNTLLTGTYIPNYPNQLAGVSGMPIVSGALTNYYLSMIFTIIVKTEVNFQTVETPTKIGFRGTWQPFSRQQIAMKPHGQRKWKWFMCHSLTPLPLQIDDVIFYKNVQYRIQDRNDYSLDGYYEYIIVDDYRGVLNE